MKIKKKFFRKYGKRKEGKDSIQIYTQIGFSVKSRICNMHPALSNHLYTITDNCPRQLARLCCVVRNRSNGTDSVTMKLHLSTTRHVSLFIIITRRIS